MDDQTSFPQWLRQRRKEYGYTQEELARLAGCSTIALRRIEAGALRPSRQLAQLLAAALGAPPEEQAALVVRARVRLRKAPESAEPPLERPGRPTGNLPTYPTSFIGREKELAGLVALLSRPSVRLLVMTGAGGSGKTRLAVQLAYRLLGQFPDGVYFADLAPLIGPQEVLPTIARVLDVAERPGQPLLDALQNYLRGKQTLVLADNFERLIDAAPQLPQLLAGAAQLKIVVTSRAVLNVYGEQEYEVPPLPLPPVTDLAETSIKQLCANEAVRLFIDRGRAARPDFEADAPSVQAIAELCTRLDGLPLAIELAAARLRVLSPRSMLDHMQHRLKILTGGPRDMPARQRTLRDTIEWSYRLLDDEEKKLFRRLAVFQGGCNLQAVERICSAAGAGGILRIEVLGGISSLVDKNLLREREGATGEPRFWMLETIQEFAREQLDESGEEAELRDSHARFFTALAEEADPKTRGPGQVEWLARLEQEHDNFRVAMRWSLDMDDHAQACRLAGNLGHFWYLRGYLGEGRRWLREALSKWRAVGMEAAAGGVAGAGGGEGEDAAAGSRAMAKALDWLGSLSVVQGDLQTGEPVLEESLALFRGVGDKWGMSHVLNSQGIAVTMRGDVEQSVALFEEALALRREIGDKTPIAISLESLGDATRQLGDHARARSYYEECLAVCRSAGIKHAQAFALNGLARVEQCMGDPQKAEQLAREGLALSLELNIVQVASYQLHCLGGMYARRGEPEKGARLLGAADALLEATGAMLEPVERAPYEQDVAAVSDQLAEATWKRVYAEGRGMSLAEAAEYALRPQPRSVEEAIECAVKRAQS